VARNLLIREISKEEYEANHLRFGTLLCSNIGEAKPQYDLYLRDQVKGWMEQKNRKFHTGSRTKGKTENGTYEKLAIQTGILAYRPWHHEACSLKSSAGNVLSFLINTLEWI